MLTSGHLRLTRWRTAAPVRLGHWRRLRPFSRVFGLDRGLPIDRYYIERFLAAHAQDIKGRVLEVADDYYTRRFGGDRVVQSDVLHATTGNPRATIIGDLAGGEGLPAGAFDCLLLTQTLQMIYDVRAAVAQACRMLAPGGVVLATLPGISQISRYDMDRWGDYWRFTDLSARRLFESTSGMQVTIEVFGNVLTAAAFLHGLAAEELKARELDATDADYQLLVAVRAVNGAVEAKA